MNISNNIIKHHLSHVYWVLGTACAGKSTTTKYLSKKHNMTRYDSDSKYDYFKSISNCVDQPEMNRIFNDWEEYFNRSPIDYAKWLNDSINEQFDMMVIDLLMMPKDKPIIVDGQSFDNTVTLISDYSHIIYLTSDVDLAIGQFMNRDDKNDLYDLIMSLPNPELKLRNVYETLRISHENEYNRIIKSGMKYIIRENETKVEHLAKLIEEHFKLGQK